MLALTRAVPPSIVRCELTHLAREPIDLDRAIEQHAAYEDALRAAGYLVQRVAPAPELPDSVFIEDTAVVFDEVAIVTRPGAASRRPETDAVELALRQHRPIVRITAPATIDGGDVLTVGRRVFVGISTRTNEPAIGQLRSILTPLGYLVTAVPIERCLHLKSAVTALDDGRVILNTAWVDGRALEPLAWIETPATEPHAANVLRAGDRLIVPAEAPHTAARLRSEGYRVETVPAAELAKAEGGVTCCSLLLA